MNAVTVSPDGTKLALAIRTQDKNFLAQLDLTTNGARPEMLGNIANSSVQELWWKGNDVILAQIGIADFASDFQSFDLTAKKINKFPSVNRNYYVSLLSLLPEDPNQVLIGAGDLRKLNVRTGTATVIEKRPDSTGRWLVDFNDTAYALTGRADKKDFLLWRPNPAARWERRELGHEDKPDFRVIRLHPDGRRLLATAHTQPGPARVVALDPATMQTEPVFFHPEVEVDFLQYFGAARSRVRSLQFETDTVQRHYLDPAAATLLASVDAALPHTVNTIGSISDDEDVALVYAHSDRDPGSFHLFKRATGKARFLGPAYPSVNPQDQQPSTHFTFKNRHGDTLQGRYILPPNTGTKPALFVLAGPWLVGPRARFQYDAWGQAFASQGYATVRIDVRGTSGYGRQFEEAGAFGVDRALPEDIEDGVAHLADAGLIDGERVGLFSLSWGGVVGLQTVAGSPRFKFWANWFSPLDLSNLRYESLSLWTRDEDASIGEMGGRRAAARYVKSLDPLKLAATLKIPTFHYYSHNASVRFSDYAKLQSILKKNGQPAQFARAAEPKNDGDITEAYYKAADELFAFLATTFPARRN